MSVKVRHNINFWRDWVNFMTPGVVLLSLIVCYRG